MYLLLGNSSEPCCIDVSKALQSRGFDSRIIDSTFADRMQFSWHLDNHRSSSRLILSDGERLAGDQIDGVLIRSAGWIDGAGWQLDDLAYVQTEAQAALLGWLWSLSCPVAGLMPASIWYRPQVPVTYWQPLLARCGLRAPDALLTNVEAEARGFGERLGAGAVYAPFSSPDRFLLATEDDWKGLSALQSCAPVCLVEPHGATALVCVVGARVVWDAEPPPDAARLETGLRRFVESVGLNFVEFAIADASGGQCIVAVDPLPHFERFGDKAKQEIVQGLVSFLTPKAEAVRSVVTPAGRSESTIVNGGQL